MSGHDIPIWSIPLKDQNGGGWHTNLKAAAAKGALNADPEKVNQVIDSMAWLGAYVVGKWWFKRKLRKLGAPEWAIYMAANTVYSAAWSAARICDVVVRRERAKRKP